MVAVYFSYKSEKSPDKPEVGPFRIRLDAPAAAKPSTALRTRRDR